MGVRARGTRGGRRRMGASLFIILLVVAHAVSSAIFFGIDGYFSYTSIASFANNTRYGVIELPPELQQASSIVNTLVLWGFLQGPGLVLLCKGKLLRGAAFLFLLACEVCFLAVPIMTELGYAMSQGANLLDLANLVYANFAFAALTLIIACLMTLALCCCGESD